MQRIDLADDCSIILGDVRDALKTVPAGTVQTCVTSPPYWGLRDYGVPGQIGLEATPEEYVASMVEVFREVWRVMRPDGTVWLNLGDCYATGAGKVGEHPGGGEQGERWKGYRGTRGGSPKHAVGAMGPMTQPNRMPLPGLKPKDLIGIPWRVALALQADGWWLRSDIVWSKLNPMPESVTDRPTRSHEYVFLLAKSERYYYDSEAIAEPASQSSQDRAYLGQRPISGRQQAMQDAGMHGKSDSLRVYDRATRNKRTVWTVATQPYPEAHFAVFPPALIEPCILAGSRPGDTVLDPFTGSGTTAEVGLRHQRAFVGCELNEEYLPLIKRRITGLQVQLAL